MSNKVDERVVQMRFDNKNFEQNVHTTMSTLDKLKQKLHLDGASKGLENVNTAAKNCNLSPISAAVESVGHKFSALEVMGVTALANITNSAVNAGKRMVKALTIEPAKTGFNEYELKMDSVKTIMASTGEEIGTVNKYLDELNEYSDQTIYSFADMTQNIGKFTNAGVELEDAAKAIKGISNEAAVSGANANEASRAMYNFAQALSAGHVKLIDWKSIENANMATVEFKNQLIETAVATGTLTKTSDGLYSTGKRTISATKEFNESLQDQWMTSEVLVETLKRYADENTDIGSKAKAAAQDVTKFTQVFDILKETAQSGWAKTWELIFGDINQAKALFTPLTKFLSGIIDKISDARNALIKGALGSPLGQLYEKISNVTSVTQSAVTKMKDLGDVVNKVIKGDYGNGQSRWDKLTEEGYDWAKVQNKVNEQLGVAVRHTEKLTEAETKQTNKIVELTDAKLKDLGLTNEEIKAYRDLEKQAKETGVPIEELIKQIDQKDGRTLLIESLTNAGEGLVKTFKAIGEAWKEVFPPMSSVQLYNIIKGINEFSQKLKMSDDTAGKLKRTLKGIFSLLGIISDVLGGAFKFGLTIINALLDMMGTDILTVTAKIGDMLVNLRQWIKEHNIFIKALEIIGPYLKKAAEGFSSWKDALKESENIPKDIIKGLINGLIKGVKGIISVAMELGKCIVETVKDVLGIQSPSKVFFAIGGFIVAGLLLGLQNGFSSVFDTLKGFGQKCVDVIKNFDFGKAFAAVIGAGITFAAVKMVDSIQNFSKAFEGVGNLLSGIGDAVEETGDGIKSFLKGLGKNLKAGAWKKRANAIRTIAIAIGILVGSLVILARAYKSDSASLFGALEILGGLAAMLMILAGAASTLGKISVDIKISYGPILAIAAALVILSFAMKSLSKLNPDTLPQAIWIVAGFGALCYALIKVTKTVGENADKAGKLISEMAGAFLLLGIAMHIIGRLNPDQATTGLLVMTGFMAFCMSLMFVSKFVGKNAEKAGNMISKIAGAVLILGIAMHIIGRLEPGEMFKGLIVLTVFGIFITQMIAVSMFAGKNADKAGKMIRSIATAILILGIAIHIIGKLTFDEMLKGLAVIAVFDIFCVQLIAVSKFAGRNAAKAGAMLLMVAGAMVIMTGVIFILSKLDPNGLMVALGAIIILGGVFAALIAVTHLAKNCMSTLIVLTVAIAVMTAALIGLSFIDPTSLATSALALGSVMGIFALLIKVTGSLKKMNTKKTLLILGSLAGVVLVLTGVLTLLSILPNPDAVLNSAMSLSLLMGVMAGVLIALDKLKIGTKAIDGVIALTAMAIPLLAFVGILAIMQCVDDAMANIKALIVLTTALTILLLPLSLIGAIIAPALLGVVGLTAMAIPLLAFVGVLAIMQSIDNAMANVTAITMLLVVMSDVLVKLALVAPLVVIGVAALAALTGLIVGIGILAVAVGALMTAFPDLEKFIDKGIPLLEKLAYGLGSIVGSLINGLLTSIVDGLPHIGEQLSKFMDNLQSFIVGAKTIDSKVLEGIGVLTASIIALSVANFINGLTELMPFCGPLEELGTKLSNFMRNATGFILGAMALNSKVVDGVKALAETILIITAADLLNGIASFFTGGNSIEKFGSDLVVLGNGLKGFVDSIGVLDDTKVESAVNAAEIIKTLAESAKTLPREGGWLQKLTGEQNLEVFATRLPGLAKGVSGFVTGLGTLNPEATNVANVAAEIIKTLADAAKEIPAQGGWMQKLTGEQNIDQFALKLPVLASGIQLFILDMQDVTSDQVSIAKTAAEMITVLAKAANEIPGSGGWLQKLVGENDIVKFCENLPNLATGVAGFVANLDGVTDKQVYVAKTATDIIKILADSSENMGKIKGKFENFSKGLKDISKGISGFISEMADVSGVDVASTKSLVLNIRSIVKDLNYVTGINAKGFSDKFKDLAKKGIKGFVNTFTSEETKEICKTAVTSMAKSAASDISTEDIRKRFISAGYFVVNGFISGIQQNIPLVETAASNMAKSAEKAARGILQINSPSKVFRSIGTSIPEGFAMGISKLGNRVSDSTDIMAKMAIDGTKNAISHITDAINSDIDTQPTIRPVLDLSNIKSGAGAINGMFGMTPSVDVLSNVGSISSMMNSQNGSNDDVISAINDLGRRLGNTSGDTYNINGVTYDDGSNVADAIRTLVRATRVERRV